MSLPRDPRQSACDDHSPDDRFEIELRKALSQLGNGGPGSGAPDLTKRIMGRLGYESVGVAEARRRRRVRWMGRAALMLGAFVAIGIGIQLHNASPDVRRPLDGGLDFVGDGRAGGVTMPAAIDRGLRDHESRLNGFMDAIRKLRPETLLRAPSLRDGADPQKFDANEYRPISIEPFGWV